MDPFLLRETERNLRALSFIRAARIARFPQRDGTVALVVHVNDAWTTEPQVNLDGVNGIDSTEIGFREKNILGRGKEVEFLYKSGKDFIERTYDYSDKRLFGTRWQMDAEAQSRTDGKLRSLQFQRPFFSADTKWSARAFHERADDLIEEFNNDNDVINEFEQEREINEVGGAVKIGGGRDFVNHAGLRYRKQTTRFHQLPETNPARGMPEPADRQIVFLDLDTTHSDFIEMTRLEKMTRVEDINKGPSVRISPGLAPRAFNGEEDETVVEATYERWSFWKEIHLLRRYYSYSGRDSFRDAENERFNLRLKYYNVSSERRTWVLGLRAEWGEDLDADNRITLGGSNGLRGYEDDKFSGNKVGVINAEGRFFFLDDLWDIFSVGAAIFMDSGGAWARGRPIALSRLKTDIGAGLRLGLTRSSNEVIVRMDAAYRAQRTSDESEWVFSFGTGQAF